MAIKPIDLIVITGPTATGKTQIATQLAISIKGEIISADSRQVYRGMDLGTGKDLADYTINGQVIPYHLIDIHDAGYEYNVFEFQNDFLSAWKDITERNKMPILCGGTGMYIESVLKGYKLLKVDDNIALRKELENCSQTELIRRLNSYKQVHNTTDTEDRKRLIRAIEIQEYYAQHPEEAKYPTFSYRIFAVNTPREIVRERITKRLQQRFDEGMINEVKGLLDNGCTPDALKFYGLEYKFLTQHVLGEINYEEMFRLLNTAIHQFAKRQMTWFRRMEKQGFEIHWLDGLQSPTKNQEIILNQLQ